MIFDSPANAQSFAFPGGDSELAQRIRAHDWRPTLGPLDTWPGPLRTVVALMLHSPVPMALLWGQDGYLLYNDAYAALAGQRHPDLLGSRVVEAWPEAAAFNAGVLNDCLSGRQPLEFRDQPFTLNRDGEPRQCWMDLFYSPVLDERGVAAGVFAVVIETTERVLARQTALEQNRRLARMFQDAPSFMARLEGPNHVYTFTNLAYQQLIAHRDVIGRAVRDALPEIAGQGLFELLDLSLIHI